MGQDRTGCRMEYSGIRCDSSVVILKSGISI